MMAKITSEMNMCESIKDYAMHDDTLLASDTVEITTGAHLMAYTASTAVSRMDEHPGSSSYQALRVAIQDLHTQMTTQTSKDFLGGIMEGIQIAENRQSSGTFGHDASSGMFSFDFTYLTEELIATIENSVTHGRFDIVSEIKPKITHFLNLLGKVAVLGLTSPTTTGDIELIKSEMRKIVPVLADFLDWLYNANGNIECMNHEEKWRKAERALISTHKLLYMATNDKISSIDTQDMCGTKVIPWLLENVGEGYFSKDMYQNCE